MNSYIKFYGKFVNLICPECGYESYGHNGIDNYCDRCFDNFSNLDGTGKIVKMLKNDEVSVENE